MRLTLRTLLAYLDDVLEPAQAKEIGDRIAENKEISDLVSRLQDVMRRRRFGAPELSGPGSGPDPNLVSEYLENALLPEQVVELERLCMQSEMHLAEVGSCHKVLTMVMGHPIDVADDVRERMYALGTGGHSRTVQPTTEDSSANSHSSPEENAADETDFSQGLPDYLIRKPIWKRFSTVLVVMLMAGVWGALVYSDSSLWKGFPGFSSTVDDQQPAVAVLEPGDESNAAVSTPANQPGPNSVAAPIEQEPKISSPVAPEPTENTPSTPVVSVNPPAPDDATIAASTNIPKPTIPNVNGSPTGPVGNGEMPAKNTSAPAVGPMPVVPKPDTPMPGDAKSVAGANAIAFTLIETSGVTIQMVPGSKGWTTLSPQLTIDPQSEVASPAPFRSDWLLEGGLRIEMEPNTRIARFNVDEKNILGLELFEGRLIFDLPDTVESSFDIAVKVGREQWLLTLSEPGTRIGIELIPAQPTGPPNVKPFPAITGGLGLFSGTAVIKRSNGKPQEWSSADAWANWPATGEELTSSSSLPAWIPPGGFLMTSTAKKLAHDYTKEFLPGNTVMESIRPAVKNRLSSISSNATRTIALIGAGRDLVPVLNSEHESSRQAAIVGLRNWVVSDPSHAEQLLVELDRNFPEDELPIVERLIWGYDTEDLRSPEISDQLLQWMMHEDIAIRELAFYYVRELTGREFKYKALLPIAERRAAIQRWQSHIEREGAMLKP